MIFNKSKLHSFLVLFACWISGCSSIEIFKENTEIAPKSGYQTFVIVNQELGMRGFASQFLDQKVQIQLQENLEKYGWKYEKNTPDVVIRYTSNEDPRTKEILPNPFPMRFWGSRIYDPWMMNPYNPMNFDNRVRVDDYELVQVIVDFIDPSRDKFLMTLTGVTEVETEKSKEKKVLKTVDKLVERFVNEVNNSPKKP